MSIQSSARDTIIGLCDDIEGYTHPINDDRLAAWQLALQRCKDMAQAIQYVCESLAAKPGPGQEALRLICQEDGTDFYEVMSPELDEAFDALEAEAKRVAEVREANRIEAAHPEVFNMTDFAASVCGFGKKA